MTAVVLAIHVIIAIALVAVILLQRSEGGALGIGGGSGGLMSSRGAGNLLTRLTAILAAGFFATSIGLTFLHSGGEPQESIVDRIESAPGQTSEEPAADPQAPAQEEPAEQPAVPLSE